MPPLAHCGTDTMLRDGGGCVVLGLDPADVSGVSTIRPRVETVAERHW